MKCDFMALGLACSLLMSSGVAVRADEAPENQSAQQKTEQQKTDSAQKAAKDQTNTKIEPKPIGEQVEKGLEYLSTQQLADGGWAEGEEAAGMRHANPNQKDTSNVADTCMAALAFVRSGNYPNSKAKFSLHVQKAAFYVMDAVEAADADSLFITNIRNTRVQAKLGQYVDTFLASLLLSELKGSMASKEDNKRLDAALDKVVHKIQKNQGDNGKWASGGWAPIHSQSLASSALNRARQMGVKVDDNALIRAEKAAKGNYDQSSRSFISEGSAGVSLYAFGANLGALQQSINTNKMQVAEVSKIAGDKKAPKAQAEWAQSELQRYKDAEELQGQAIASVTSKLNDQRFIQGFGCNGGEEFLSYLQISETLLSNQSKEFKDWDKKICANLERVQNPDGSWMGQHCITSRTFCTSAAVMVMTADRSPVLKVIAELKNKDQL